MLSVERKSNRLKKFDYSSAGYYFVTICVQDRACCFGDVINDKMVINEYGKIVEKFWFEIPKHNKNASLDIFQIMPNHLHGIVVINPVGADIIRPYGAGLSKIIGYFKQTASKIIRRSGFISFSWQKSFYDHIIRTGESLDKIREYIQNNPKQWELDKLNPKN